MKHERLLALVDVFLHEGRRTAEELASRFGVSERTIYRDIDALCAAGVPLTAEAGAGGGYELVEGYRIDRSFLSAEEAADLSALLRGLVEALKDRHLERSLGKIAALGAAAPAPGTWRPAAGTASGCVHPLPPPLIATLAPWGAGGPAPHLVDDLRRAVAERRLVSFGYLDGEGRATDRRVEPFSLVIGGATWYLHGFCRLRGAFRLFRLTRMRRAVLLSERFDPYARVPAPPPFIGGDEAQVPVVLDAEASLSAALEEAFPGALREETADGTLRYRFDYPTGPWFVRLLLFFGPGLRIREPAELREAYARAARLMAENNGA